MKRLFDEHIKRKTEFLNGIWKFKTDEKNIGISEKWFEKSQNGIDVYVPSVWNTYENLLEYEGKGWYQKEFYTNGGTIRLVFEGVMTEGYVWLDGEFLGKHYGGFTQFDFILHNVKAGKHALCVMADNTFDENSVPQATVDWYHYGGITRSVSFEELNGIAVISSHFDYTLSEDLKDASCTLETELYNSTDSKLESEIIVRLENEIIYKGTVEVEGRSYKNFSVKDLKIENIKLWDEGAPNLYTLEINTETDDLIDKVGFRKIEAKDGEILLNGRKIELRGTNHHEDHPDFGFAMPTQLMIKDIEIIKKMGCNTVRGSHYPNSQIFVDMLDAQGILFWSEIPIWGVGFTEEALGNSEIVRRGLTMHKEMLKYYFNHPSIVIWGLHNEIKTHCENAYNMSKLYFEYVKANGGNRLVTYASSLPLTDTCFEFCDIMCINKYFGWYDEETDYWVKFLEEMRELRKKLKMENKPVIISEFGAGAIYGHKTFDNIRWCEEYQAGLFDYTLNLFHKDDMIKGFYIWQYSDMRTAKELGLNRARGFNNKGVLNEYRKPKMAYFTVRDNYIKFKNETM